MSGKKDGVVISLPALTLLTWLGTIGLAIYVSEKFNNIWMVLGVLLMGLVAMGKVKGREILDYLAKYDSISLGNLTKKDPITDKEIKELKDRQEEVV